MEMYDLIILGGGYAAFGAAIKATDLGAKVAMIEKGTIGGTCVNVGCVPSKHLLGVGKISYYRNHGHAGLEMSSSLDLARVIGEKREIVESLRQSRYIDVIDALGITVVRGKAVFSSQETRYRYQSLCRQVHHRHRFVSPHPPHRRLGDLGLESAGVEVADNGAVVVAAEMKTTHPKSGPQAMLSARPCWKR